ncbi:hypothetical protein [Streptomyces sp. MP131-18]|uniref:hypothetical protein n=1 Tax=Streptomyces sp. MP131-18 TaxID=1857892 RepID=UPI0009CAB357|nr:hypothetical protein [Streptomyces sp. MP131-18]ONK13610.1 3-oxoacyl-(acyl carrier protein) synthase II [Streptomyces sp. MP131-18]
MTPSPIGIPGTGSCAPERHIGNGEIAVHLDMPEKWTEKRTEIAGHRWAAPHEAGARLLHRVGAA